MTDGKVFAGQVMEGKSLIEDTKGVTQEDCDVCIIGSGCGGSTLAVRLAEKGMRVVIVERGGYYTRKDFDQREDNMIAKIDGGRGFDTSVDGSISLTYGNNVGGASVHFWADSYRTPVDRLERWEIEFGLKGHGASDLAPFWEELERDHNVHEAEPKYYNKMNLLLKEGAGKLGWKGHAIPQARKNCVQSGYCMQGCSYDFKQSQIVTYIPRSLAAGAKIYSDTEARSLHWDSASKVRALECVVIDRDTGRPTSKKVMITAKKFVVAAGGFGSPVFLLKQGLQKRLPALGRHTYANPSPMVSALYDQEIIIYRNIPAAWGVDEFRLARTENGKPDGKYIEGGYMFVANQLQPATFAAVLPATGRAMRDIMKNFRYLGGTICWIDDHDEGHIEIKDDRPQFHTPTDGANGLRIRDSILKQSLMLATTGAREIIFGDTDDTRYRPSGKPEVLWQKEITQIVANLDLSAGRIIMAAPHPAGGARMGSDPKTSVVGMDHRVHGVDNLFVADPSVFPTAPSVDPSLTIMAFSCVAAKHVLA